MVKTIAGDEGVVTCRSLLDGNDDDVEADLQSRVTEGRCHVCMGSTYDDSDEVSEWLANGLSVGVRKGWWGGFS